jgi:methylmalonyl-CoA mutase N-terminal domain/subunit
MHIDDDFAPNHVLLQQRHGRIHRDGRVARRIWAVAMKEAMAQRAQPEARNTTSRPAGAACTQGNQFNDIRTTLQALIAIYDNCNSLLHQRV